MRSIFGRIEGAGGGGCAAVAVIQIGLPMRWEHYKNTLSLPATLSFPISLYIHPIVRRKHHDA